VPPAVYGFISWVERESHFQVHELEFNPPFASGAEYEIAPIAFLTAPVTATVMECVRRNGDTIRYNPPTNEFAICDRDGVLRTY
jgi:pyocin large subunit-like protein